MDKTRKNIFFTLLVALYFLTSQATVIVLVVQWYSTAAHQSVQMRADNARETGELRWSPRTHLPMDGQTELSASEPTGHIDFPTFLRYQRLVSQAPLALYASEYFSLLSNKAPPRA